MMRKIAIGLAVVTIAMGGSTLSASALHGHKGGISKSSMSKSVSHRFGPRTYAFSDEEAGRRIDRERRSDRYAGGYRPDRFDGVSRHRRGERLAGGYTPDRFEGVSRSRIARYDRGDRRFDRYDIDRVYDRLSRLERDLDRLYSDRHAGYDRYSRYDRGERLSRIDRERARYYRRGAYGRR
jgi:hypothetical protein